MASKDLEAQLRFEVVAVESPELEVVVRVVEDQVHFEGAGVGGGAEEAAEGAASGV